jgi:hypothetical protein
MPGFDALAELAARRPYRPLDALYAAIRRRVPLLAVARVTEPEECVTVTYRERGPWRITWDAETELFVWASGTEKGNPVGTRKDIDRTAEHAAHALGVSVNPGPH